MWETTLSKCVVYIRKTSSSVVFFLCVCVLFVSFFLGGGGLGGGFGRGWGFVIWLLNEVVNVTWISYEECKLKCKLSKSVIHFLCQWYDDAKTPCFYEILSENDQIFFLLDLVRVDQILKKCVNFGTSLSTGNRCYRVDSPPPPSRSSPRKIVSRVESPLGRNPALEPAFPLQDFGVKFPP